MLARISNRLGLFWGDMNALMHGCPIKPFGAVFCNPNKINRSTKFFKIREQRYLLNNEDMDRTLIKNKLIQFIASGDWDAYCVDLEENGIIQRAYAHFVAKKTWDEVGEVEWLQNNIIAHGEQDSCITREDIDKRLFALDELFAELAAGKELILQKYHQKRAFRERGGICVAIDRNGELIWMGDGAHRLAMAKILEIKKIPIAIILVHSEALKNNIYMKNIEY